MNKTIKITLAISLIINLVGLGIFLGRSSHELKDKCPMNKSSKFERAHLKGLGELAKSGHQEMKTKRDELFAILTADTFDPELYQSKLDEIGALHHSKMQMISQKIKEKAMTMNQEERKELAEDMRRFHRKRRKYHRGQ